MKDMSLKIDDSEYVIVSDYGNFAYYKVVDGKRQLLNLEELKRLQTEIAKIDYKQMDLETLKVKLKESITNGEILNHDDLIKYIEGLGDIPKKDELISYGDGLLSEKNVVFTPLDELCEEILNELKSYSDIEKTFNINFKVYNNSLSDDYMEISMFSKKDDVKYDYPSRYVIFNEETKEKLIKPVLTEIILKEEVVYNKSFNIESIADYKANYFLKTLNNYFVSVLNVSQDYAKEFEKLIFELHSKYGLSNDEERIENIQNELVLEDEMKLVRKKNDNRGFANYFVMYASLNFIIILLVLFQIIFLII